MGTEYKLSYTASEIDKRLGMVDDMVKSVNGIIPDESGNVKIAISESNSGMTPTASALLLTILKNGVYTSDQSANITALDNALKENSGGSGDNEDSGDSGDSGGTETTTYTITNNLTNCTNSNGATTIAENTTYNAVIAPSVGYEIESISVIMGGNTISVTGNIINIPSVTGNIVITATATAIQTELVEEILNPVWTTSYPDKTTFEFTEIEGEVGEAASKYVGYAVFEQSAMSGGILHLDLDTTRLSSYKVFIYLYQNGVPYKVVATKSAASMNSGELVDGVNINVDDLGETNTWIFLDGSATYRVPDGCTVMVALGFISGTSTILDENLMIDGNATSKMYKVYDAIKAGEVITAKLVKETSGDSGETETTTYTITNNLTNCINSNGATTIAHGASYNAVITAVDGYNVDSISVTMGGNPIETTNGVISIPSVTGDIVITATATATESVETSERLEWFWTGNINGTTYEYELLDMSGGSAQKVYTSSCNVLATSDGSNTTLKLTLDKTKINKYKFRMFLYDSEGNAYKASNTLGGYENCYSGDLTNVIQLKDPGSVSRVFVDGDWSYEIPSGYSVLINVEFADALQYSTIADTSLLDSNGKVYGVVDAVTFNGVGINAYVIKGE